jgi:hypothetical protein
MASQGTVAYCGLIPNCFNNMCVRLVFSVNDRNTLKQMTINDCNFGIIQKNEGYYCYFDKQSSLTHVKAGCQKSADNVLGRWGKCGKLPNKALAFTFSPIDLRATIACEVRYVGKCMKQL